MKKKVLIFILLLGFVLLKIPTVKGEGGTNVFHFKINKYTFFPDEYLYINASWYSQYEDPWGEYFMQYRIYNNTDFLNDFSSIPIWNSTKYCGLNQVVEKIENISISSIIDIETFEEPIELYLALYRFTHEPLPEVPNSYIFIDPPDCPIHNITITGKSSFDPQYLEINKEIFYPNETLIFNSLWEMKYYEPQNYYTQFQIFNSTKFWSENILWKSEKYNDSGQISKEVFLALENIIDLNMSVNDSFELYLSLYYHYVDDFETINQYYCNKSFRVIQRGSYQFQSLEINKHMYYQNETIEIDVLWDLSYHEPEISYFQFQIFNNSIPSNQTLIYKSEKYYEKGYKNRSISIPIYNILNDSLDNSINLTLKLTYFLEDLNNIRYNKYITNFSITVNPVPPSSNLNPNNQNIYFNILLPSGIGGGFLVIGLVLYFTKREKKKNAEELVIEF